MQKVDILQSFIKGAAVSGIGLVWFNFTIKSFKTAWRIKFTFPEEETWKAVSRVVCEECQEHFFDDGNELKNGRCFCEACGDYELDKKKTEL